MTDFNVIFIDFIDVFDTLNRSVSYDMLYIQGFIRFSLFVLTENYKLTLLGLRI
jgi:hypothetical protein